MKALHILTALLVTGACLTSCEMSDELSGSSSSSEVGYVDLGLTVSENYNTISRATATQTSSSSSDVSTFIVSFIDDDSSETVYSATYEEISSAGEIELPVGTYTMQANSDLTLVSVMSEPYYLGTTSLSIVKDETTSASAICYMENTKIQLVLDDTFISNMASWEITITDGSNALAYSSTDDDAANPAAWYILVPDGTTYITITVTGTTVDGITVAESQSIAKDEDGTAWTSNDALSITVAIGETDGNSDTATEVTYAAIFNISVDWTFADENDEYVTIEVDPVVTESETTDDDTTDSGDDESDDENLPSITSDYLDGITFSISEADYPSSAVFVISAPLGFQTLLIDITSGNDLFAQGLALVSLDEEFDLLTLSSDYSEIFGTMPVAGDTEYSLDLGGFFSLMIPFGTTSSDGHQFKITVTDTEGNTATATIKIVLTE